MDTIRFGIVGFGTQGSTYCHLLAGVPLYPGMEASAPAGCALGAVCTSSGEKKAVIEAKFPGVAVFENYEEMLASGLCDAVIPTVPHYQHHEMAIAAMEAGLSVLSEKPAAVLARDARRMLEAAERTGKTLGLFYNQRTNPLYRRIKEILSSGELGGIRRSVWIINTWWRPDAYYRQNSWRATWGGEGGGVLVNQAPHQLDLWQWLCGVPTEVTAVNRCGAYRDIAAENDVTLLTRYENGATGVFISCTHDPMGTDRLEIHCDGGKILVEDSKKCTVYRLKHSGKPVDEGYLNEHLSMMELTKEMHSGSLYETETLEATGGWGIQHRQVMENFAAHLLHGESLLADGLDGLRGVELANAAQLSGWLGRTVPVPCDEEAYRRELNKRIAEEGKFPLRK